MALECLQATVEPILEQLLASFVGANRHAITAAGAFDLAGQLTSAVAEAPAE